MNGNKLKLAVTAPLNAGDVVVSTSGTRIPLGTLVGLLLEKFNVEVVFHPEQTKPSWFSLKTRR